MSQVCSIFSQLLQLFPRAEFEQAVRQHRGERHARGFTCWGQFVAMLFCQLGRAQSLREICGGLAASQGKLRHLGLSAAPPRSTLAYANRQRPWADLRNRLSAAAGEVPRRGAGPQVPFQKQAAESGRQRHRPVRLAVRLGPFPAHQRRRQAASGARPRRLSAQLLRGHRRQDARPGAGPPDVVRPRHDRGLRPRLQRLRLVRRAERAGRFLCHPIEARGRLRGSRTAPVAEPPRRRAPGRSDFSFPRWPPAAARWCSAASNTSTPSSSARWCF